MVALLTLINIYVYRLTRFYANRIYFVVFYLLNYANYATATIKRQISTTQAAMQPFAKNYFICLLSNFARFNCFRFTLFLSSHLLLLLLVNPPIRSRARNETELTTRLAKERARESRRTQQRESREPESELGASLHEVVNQPTRTNFTLSLNLIFFFAARMCRSTF